MQLDEAKLFWSVKKPQRRFTSPTIVDYGRVVLARKDSQKLTSPTVTFDDTPLSRHPVVSNRNSVWPSATMLLNSDIVSLMSST